MSSLKQFIVKRGQNLGDYMGGGKGPKTLGLVLAAYLLIALVLGMYWSAEPDTFSVRAQVADYEKTQGKAVIGYATVSTFVHMADVLLDKPGGYLSNDLFPPGVWLDNVPNWEYGVLVQLRDLARALRRDISRSQSQSKEDVDLTQADPQFHFDNNSWAIPASETEYRRGIKAMQRYLDRLSDPQTPDAQFYARADNLRNWLSDVENRLGSLSRRLSESVGKQQLNLSLAGDPAATQSTVGEGAREVKTPWLEIDDVFYEARGYTWALLHALQAIEIDFRDVLENKNALVSLQQIILELEASQAGIWSPVILNGSGFGMLANHSLTMASYMSRANAAIIDLRSLLQQG